jgi:putative drug exporter of the RND superfamily
VHAVFSALGRFSVRFRWLVLVVWLVAAAAVVALLPSLASVVQSNSADFLPASSPSAKAAVLGAAFQPSGQFAVPVVVVDGGQADPGYLDRLTGDLKAVDGVASVADLGRSADGQADQLRVLTTVTPGPGNAAATLVGNLRQAVRAADPPAGVATHVAGQLATAVDNQASSKGQGSDVQNLSVLFIVVLLLVIFRALLAPLVTLLPALLVSQMAGPVIAVIAQHGLKVSSLAQLMLIVLVLGAGTDYGLFLVFRVRENLRAGMDKREAVVAAVERVGESIAASAGTVIAALLSLLVASFGLYRDLGAPLAIGIGLMLLAGLTLLPALLAILGRAVFWPSRIRPLEDGRAERPGLWGRTAARIVRRPAVTLVAGVLAFAALALVSLGYTAAGFGSGSGAPAGSDSAAGQAAIAAHYPRAAANPTNVYLRWDEPVWTHPQDVQRAGDLLRSAPEFSAVTGPLDPNGTPLTLAQLAGLHARYGTPAQAAAQARAAAAAGARPPADLLVYAAEAQYVSADGRTVAFSTSLRAGDPAGTAALQAVPAVRAAAARAAAASGAADQGVSGQAPALYDVSATSNGDLKKVVPLAIAIIGVLLALVMRSLVAPLYLIVSVGLSYLAALGLCVLVFQIGLGDGGLTFILPFLMFLFLLALGEDYNILVMTRIREEAVRRPLRDAVTIAVQATGTTITSAGVVLAGTFAVFAVAAGSGSNGNTQIRDVGTGLALGVLMDTFLVRTLLVPATVVLLGRWNWWPSRLARRSADRPAEPAPELAAAP